MQRIGLLGGSFNPAHDGHRYISLLALKRLDLDAVWWIVTPQNPLKSASETAPFAERMAGAIKVARHPRIRVTDIEQRLGTVHTAGTLMALLPRFPDCRFVWLMGADNLVQICAWKHWRSIFSLVPIAVFSRAPYSRSAFASRAARAFSDYRVPESRARSLAMMRSPAWLFLNIPPHSGSATRIREGWAAALAAT